MMCDECGIRPAKIHLTTITNEIKSERNLCPVCMAKYQKKLPSIDFSNLAGILSGFIEKTAGNKLEGDTEEHGELCCQFCGTTYKEFKKTGMLGCAECYNAFKRPLEELLLRIHGNAQHAGRIPGGAKNNVSIRMNIDRMKQLLAKAIADEEYEEAATLRDGIRALKSQLEPEETIEEESKHE